MGVNVVLSPIGGAAQQFFDNNGNVLSGGKLYTYIAGSTTPLATYASSLGIVANSNPVILDSAGRVSSGGIWLILGSAYKFVIKSSTDTLIGTYDNITGGSAANASALNVFSVVQYGAIGNGIIDDYVACAAALAAAAAVGGTLLFPGGLTYHLGTGLTTALPHLTVQGYGATITTTANITVLNFDTGADYAVVEGLNITGSSVGGNQRGIVSNAKHGTFADMVFRNLGSYGIYLTGSGNYNLLENLIANACYAEPTNSGDYGCFAVNGGSYNTLINCRAVNPVRAGLSLYNASYTRVVDFSSISTSPATFQTSGIFELQGSKNNTYINVYLENSTAELFDLRGDGYAQITNLRVKGASAYGLAINKNLNTPKNISVVGFVSELTSGWNLYLSGGTGTTDAISDCSFKDCYFIQTTTGGVDFLQYTQRIVFDACVFDACSFTHDGGAGHSATFNDCRFINYNNNGGKILFVTNTELVECVFQNITALAIIERSFTTRVNNRLRRCKTAGTNTITYLSSGTNAAGSTDANIIWFDGCTFDDITTSADYTTRPPAIVLPIQEQPTPGTVATFPTPASLVDGTATGPTNSDFNCGYSSSAVGDLIYLDSSATWQKCDANTLALYNGFLGIALQVKASGAALTVALPGSFVYAAAAFPTFTVGSPVYMSETPGLVTQTAPTTTDSATRVVGWGINADKMYFNPSPDYLTHI